jgi:pimeloyl-ACP methyl ester carboxylesterase
MRTGRLHHLLPLFTASTRICVGAAAASSSRGAEKISMRWGSSSSQQPKHAIRETGVLSEGMAYIDHHFSVPLRWRQLSHDSTGGAETKKHAVPVDHISIHVKEIISARAQRSGDSHKLPALLFLQGGPGFPSPRVKGSAGWVGRALEGHRIFLLDQRGTGRSTPVTADFLLDKDIFESPEQQAEYLSHFRADSIVEDCEAIRRELLGSDGKWTVLGQSFGGFCLLRYMSKHSSALEAALFTGGLPPIDSTADEIYSHTFRRCAERNRRYYARYPDDVEKVKNIVRYLMQNDVVMPCGGSLSPERFLQLGIILGGKYGFDTLHYLVDDAFEGGVNGGLGYSFLREVENLQSFDTNPVYAVLHEAIYCQENASQWSADRVLSQDETVSSGFDYRANLDDVDQPVYFTGEFIFPSMFNGSFPKLEGLRECANLLAERVWPRLYSREALSECSVPVAAAIFIDDMYVEHRFSQETAAVLPNCRTWVTNIYQHSALRDDGSKIFATLLGMARGEIDIPS